MKYKSVQIISRTDGGTEEAKLFVCDVYGEEGFLIYMVKGHPHLQRLKCDTTFCQNDSCKGAKQLRVSKN